jgi:hypothetical protein
MITIEKETTGQPPMVCRAPRSGAFKPPKYTYDFADESDAPRIAALAGYDSVAVARASLVGGEDEWIVARQGGALVGVVRVRTVEPWRSHTIDAPVIATEHRRRGLERYLKHLAEIWIESISLPVAA